jgi:hypothetical protein
VAYISTYKCDSCGIVKKQVNNWFTIESCSTIDESIKSFYITKPFNEQHAFTYRADKSVQHTCGLECAAKIEMRLKAEMHAPHAKTSSDDKIASISIPLSDDEDCSGENYYMKNDDDIPF